MKVLNLYGGLGGNRKLWGDEHEITAVEINPEIAALYQELYPNDTVIVGDAHQYLIDNVLNGWDFIWASPPCPSHSRINTDGNQKPKYPEMTLYQEIIMLSNNWYKGKWCIENVIPYYKPLIPPSAKIGRHLFWSNFHISKIELKKEKTLAEQNVKSGRYGFCIKYKKINYRKNKILRNLINPKLGLHIFNRAAGIYEANNSKQKTLF